MSGDKDQCFFKKPYMGSDGIDFKVDLIDYLREILKENSFEAMSDYQLFLKGGEKAIKELIGILGELKEAEQEVGVE